MAVFARSGSLQPGSPETQSRTLMPAAWRRPVMPAKSVGVAGGSVNETSPQPATTIPALARRAARRARDEGRRPGSIASEASTGRPVATPGAFGSLRTDPRRSPPGPRSSPLARAHRHSPALIAHGPALFAARPAPIAARPAPIAALDGSFVARRDTRGVSHRAGLLLHVSARSSRLVAKIPSQRAIRAALGLSPASGQRAISLVTGASPPAAAQGCPSSPFQVQDPGRTLEPGQGEAPQPPRRPAERHGQGPTQELRA